MGINIDRFIGDVDSNFICSICNDVLEDPLQAPKCEHSFCKLCIMQWLNTNNSCPLDRKKLTVNNLKPVSRILRSLLLRLTLTCNNQIHGCPATVALEELETHLLECSFNPKRLVSCSSGCGVTISFGELANHNCVQSLRLEMKETLERIEKANEDKISKILGLELELMLVQKLERVEKENKNKMSKMLGINANLVQKLEKVEKANEEKMSKILSIHANLVEKLERVKKETEDKMSKVHNINSNLVKRLERVEKETEHKLSKMHNINANLSKELERVKKANEDEMSKILGINANLVEKLERVEKGNEDKTSKMHNINAHLVKELERVKKVNEYEMSKILGINANLVEKLERVEKGNEDKMSKMHNINTNLVKTLERVEKETEDKMSKMHDINTNLVKRLERVEKETGDQRSKMHNINITKMSEILGINANLVEKLERVEKGNEDKMLMIKSKLELLEAEMAKFRLSKSNSLHVESATLKQRLVAHVMSCVIQENVKIKEECRKLKRAAAIRESNVDNFVRIHTQSFFQPITYARLINFVLIGLRIPINCFRSICFN